MTAGKAHFPDPDIQIGAFRVLPRTDGKWAIVDTRRPAGQRTIHVAKSKQDAVTVAQRWHGEGYG